MLYNAVLVFTVQQSESAIGIYRSLPLEPPTLPGHHRDPAELLVLHSCFPAAVYSAHGSVYSQCYLAAFKDPFPQLKENKNVYGSSGREITWLAKVQSIQTKHIAPYVELHRDLISSF